MSLIWVIIGTAFQLFMAQFLLMVVAFSSAGMANSRSVNKIQSAILFMSLLLLPALCFVSAGIVIYEYNTGGSSDAYWWYGVPIVAGIAYFIFAAVLNHNA